MISNGPRNEDNDVVVVVGRTLVLRMSLIYSHKLSDCDFPIRLITSCSNHDGMSCKLSDVIFYEYNDATGGGKKPSGKTFSELETFVERCEDAFRVSFFRTGADDPSTTNEKKDATFECSLELEIRYRTRVIPMDAAILFQIGLSLKNQYGRRCTREGGMCYVKISELLFNAALKRKNAGVEHYSLRRVCCSASNYKGKRWTGSMAVRLCSESSDRSHARSGDNDGDNEDDVGKEREPDSNSNGTCPRTYVFCGGCTIGPSRGRKSSNNANEKTSFVSEETAFRMLFGVEPNVGAEPNANAVAATAGIRSNPVGPGEFGSSANKAVVKYEKARLKKDWYENWRKIKNQDRLVYVDLETTSRMKCPLAPMDACIWQEMEPYGSCYIRTLGNDVPQPVSSKYAKRGRRATEINNQGNDGGGGAFAVMDEKYFKRYVGVANAPSENISSKLNSELRVERKGALDPDVMDVWFRRFKNPEEGNRWYLPFYAYLKAPPLRTYAGFWTALLEVLISRENFESLDRFRSFFFDGSVSHYVRATYAMKLICLYPQCIEYLSDYSVELAKDGSGRTEKKEVEQFWNCLTSMVADCEDSSLGIYQIYEAFVLKPDERTTIEQRNNDVLGEMRRILLHNYLVLLNIEGVHLYKQTNAAAAAASDDCCDSTYDAERKFHSKLEVGLNEEYIEATKKLNSAHAAVKLIPKLYFERCVNRSMECLGRKKVFRKTKDSRPGHRCRCSYHKYPPDDYNDELDVLFGEGTSKLSPGFEKSTCKYEWFDRAMAGNDLINDIVKTTLYPSKKGSDFYKASFFGITPHFSSEHGVNTFKYCRPMSRDARVNEFVSSNYPFLKGVSYAQLCRKDERIVILPAGEYLSSARDRTRSDDWVGRSEQCKGVRFQERESTGSMENIVESECKYRMGPKKIGKVMAKTKIEEERQRYSLNNPVGANRNIRNYPYNMVVDDTIRDLKTSKTIVEKWVGRMNEEFYRSPSKSTENAKKTASSSDFKNAFLKYDSHAYPGGHYQMCVDNYYITDDFLELISKTVRDGLKKHRKEHCCIRTEGELEELSNDMRTWRITFYLR